MSEPSPYFASAYTLKEGPLAGWRTWAGLANTDPFETHIGPLAFRHDADGRPRCAFMPEEKHLNGGAFVHGGALMSFVDFALFIIAQDALGGSAVTLTCNNEFISTAQPGILIEATGEVLRAARSVVFLRGVLTQNTQTVLSFSATLKIRSRRS